MMRRKQWVYGAMSLLVAIFGYVGLRSSALVSAQTDIGGGTKGTTEGTAGVDGGGSTGTPGGGTETGGSTTGGAGGTCVEGKWCEPTPGACGSNGSCLNFRCVCRGGSTPVCGDGILDKTKEECDLGTLNGPNTACSTSCTLNEPSCVVFADPYATYVGSGVAFSLSGLNEPYILGVTGCVITYGDGQTGAFDYPGQDHVHAFGYTGIFDHTISCFYAYRGVEGVYPMMCAGVRPVVVYDTGADTTCVNVFGTMTHSYCYSREYGEPVTGDIREFVSGGASFQIFTGNLYQQQVNSLLALGATNISYTITARTADGTTLPVYPISAPYNYAYWQFAMASEAGFPIKISSSVTFLYNGIYYQLNGSKTYAKDRYHQDCEVHDFSWVPLYCQPLTRPGVCGSAHETVFSTPPSEGELCAQGTVAALTETPGGWTWTCVGPYNGSVASCSAEKPIDCGDGTVNGNEQCDDGGVIPGDGCSAVCMFETPTCTLLAAPSTTYIGSGVMFTGYTEQSWGSLSTIDFGNGVTRTGLNGMYYFDNYNGYGAPGVYTATLYVANTLPGASAYSGSCEVVLTMLTDAQDPLPEFQKIAEVGQSGEITIIHYTITAYIPAGQNMATIYDGLSQGADIASIDTGSLSVAPHNSNPNAQFAVEDVQGFINGYGNVWAYLAHISGSGGTWFTLSYDVIPTTGGMICNICQLFEGGYQLSDTHQGGWFSLFSPMTYAQPSPIDQIQICSFIPTFTKKVVSSTPSTITYRIDGTIATGGVPFIVSDSYGTLTQNGPLTYGPTGVPGLTFTPQVGGVAGATGFVLQIVNTTSTTQSYSIVFTLNLAPQGGDCNQARLDWTTTYNGAWSTNEYISDNPGTLETANDETCGCPAGQIYQNGACRDQSCDDGTLPSDQGPIVVCNVSATAANQSYVYDTSCTAPCAYTCADDTIRVGNTCVAACDQSTLPANMLGVEICSNGLIPAAVTGYHYVNGGCENAGATLCPFSCSQGYTWNGSACVQNVCAGTLPAHTSFCVSPQIPDTNNEPIAYNEDCVAPFPPKACDFDCDPGYTWNGTECVVANYMSKTAVLYGSTITYTIQGMVTSFMPETTYFADSILTDNATINQDVSFVSNDGLSAGSITYTNNGFSFDLTRDSDGGSFVITFTAHAESGGNEEVCNEATIDGGPAIVYSDNPETPSPNDSTVSDPTCVSGYDLEMIKFVQPTWSSEYYPENIADGIVYHGDWYVYHIKVINNGAGDALNAHVTDTFPAGVTAYWSENIPDGVTFVPPLLDGAGSFTWDIERLNVGEYLEFDVWVTFDNKIAGLSAGDTYCNIARVTSKADTEPGNNFDARTSNDDACLTLGDCKNRACKGQIYATGLVWTVNGTTQNGTIRVDGTCVVEATCDDSETFEADPAELVYGESTFTLPVGQIGNITLPSDRDGGTTGVSINLTSVNSACAYVEDRIAERDGTSGAPQDFQNYNVSACEEVGGQVTFTVQHRTWKHWLTCRKQPLNACSTKYAMATYEIAPATWATLEDVAAAESLKETAHGAYVQWRPALGVNVHHWENFGCDLCGKDPDIPNDCGDKICTECPAGTYAHTTNIGGTGNVTITCLCESNGQPPVNGECPDISSPSKTVVRNGNTLYYTLSGLYIPVGEQGVIVLDEISGSVQLTNGSVSLLGNGVTLVGVNMTATTLEAYVVRSSGGAGTGPVFFGMTYQATVVSDSAEICNQASVTTGVGVPPFVVSDNPATPGSDDPTCICGPGYELCNEVCVPVGTCNPPAVTGTVDKTAYVSGDKIYYTITVTVPTSGSVLVYDQISGGATYNNDFVGSSVSGNGTFSWMPQPASTQVTFTVTNTTNTLLVYKITYTASYDKTTTHSPLVCNVVQISSLGSGKNGTTIGGSLTTMGGAGSTTSVGSVGALDGTVSKVILGNDLGVGSTDSSLGSTKDVNSGVPGKDTMGGGTLTPTDTTPTGTVKDTTNGTTTVGPSVPTTTAKEVCLCGPGYELCNGECVPTGTCNPPAVTGDVQKTSVVSGNVIMYKIVATVPTFGWMTVTDVLTGGGVYVGDFTGRTTTGTGTFSWTPAQPLSNVVFTITNTSTTGPLVYVIEYSVTKSGWAAGQAQICNAVQVSGTTVSTGTCNCPSGTEVCDGICVAVGTCNPPAVTGDVQKTSVVSGNVIMYKIVATVPTFGWMTVTDVLTGGGVYVGDFTGRVTTGTGTFSWTPAQPLSNVAFTIANKSTTGPLVYVIEYSVTKSGWAAGQAQICNAVQVSGTTVSTGTCNCPSGTEVCDGICVAIGTCNPPAVTGDVQKTSVVSGNVIMYKIVATVPTFGWMTVTDVLTGGGVYVGDFTGRATTGTGTFSWTPAQPLSNVAFTVTNKSTTSPLVYVIEYSVTKSGWAAGQAQICNAVQVSGTTVSTGTCNCPSGTEVCDGICVAVGTCSTQLTGNILMKKIVNKTGVVVGESLSYTITLTNTGLVSVSGITVTDTPPMFVSGTFVPVPSLISGSTYMWNIASLGTGQTYTIVFNGVVTCQGATCPTVRSTMCNVATLMFPGSSGQRTDSACTTIVECKSDTDCPNGYCDNGMCVADNMCSSLILTPLTGTAPLTAAYTCVGVGNGYFVSVRNASGTVVASGTTASGSFTFAQNDTYTVQCAVGNDVGTQCNALALGVTGAKQLLDSYATRLSSANLLSGITSITWGGLSSISLAPLLNVTTQQLITNLTSGATTYLIQNIVSQPTGMTGVTYGTGGAPVLTVPPLAQVIASLKTIAQQLVAEQCVETCVAHVTVSSGGTTTGTNTGVVDSCLDLATMDNTNVKQIAHTVHFTCEAEASFSGALMQILCDTTNAGANDNVKILTGYAKLVDGKAVLDGICAYNGYASYQARCTVAGGEDLDGSCTQSVLLRSGGGGNTPNPPSNPNNPNSPLHTPTIVGEEPKCAYIDPPSIHVGEYLPFWWDLEANNRFSYSSEHSCVGKPTGLILKDDMMCHFSLYNGRSNNPITSITEPCFENIWEGNRIFKDKYFLDPQIQKAMGKSYLKIGSDLVGTTYGEYQIVLDSITYKYCDKEVIKQKSFDGRVCAMNFAVANGYLMHQGVGLSTTSDTDLSMFKSLRGDPIIPQQQLRSITRLVQAVAGSSERDYLLEKVVEENAKLATLRVDHVGTSNILGSKLKKVPSKEVYVVEGDFTIRNVTAANDTPYTLIVRHGNLTVEGSVDANAMFIVPDGKIFFNNIDCDERDVVRGIYMTKFGFGTKKVRNDELNATNWCMQGGLVIEGMLMGPGIGEESFVDGRRATLADWFDLNEDTQKEKIFEGASVLVKTNPSLWRNLPPTANEFVERLNIWK